MGLRSKEQAAARPTAGIALSRTEQRDLRGLSLRGTDDPWALRARIVLSVARGNTGAEIARTWDISPATVCKWRRRFLAERMGALQSRVRPRPSRRMATERVAHVQNLLGTPGLSTREIAARAKVSQTSVVRIQRKVKEQRE
jgi:transposase